MQNRAHHNTTGSTERHWISGQEAKSINRGEVNSTDACLTGANPVAMVIKEGWPHFLELGFHPWIFPRKTELIFFIWLFYWLLIWGFLTFEGQILPPFSGTSSLTFMCPLVQASSLSEPNSNSSTCLSSHLLFTYALESKCDRKALISHVWVIILPSLLSILEAEQREQRIRNQPTVWLWTGWTNLLSVPANAYVPLSLSAKLLVLESSPRSYKGKTERKQRLCSKMRYWYLHSVHTLRDCLALPM